MKTSTLFATLAASVAVSLAASGAALAQEATYEYPQATASQTARAAVAAELKQARAEGRVLVGEAEVRHSAPFIPGATRAEVKAQAVAALASGEFRNLHGEYTAHPVAPASSTLRLAGK